MARIIEGTLFKLVYAVGGRVAPALVIEAASMDDADKAVLLHASEQAAYSGEEIRILSATEIDLGAL